MLTGKQFQLERTTLAIGDFEGKRQAVPIPLGMILKVVTEPREGDKLVDILWDGKVYQMFEEDLKARATDLEQQTA